ncbi:hypothetical protein OpiT1DRAFT_04875 [Opitutaceae bacterium TAV1]|nr:hypothetical protein OpiT1DRAFT_04875 [Opitutaceae bacterium TAV1]
MAAKERKILPRVTPSIASIGAREILAGQTDPLRPFAAKNFLSIPAASHPLRP